MKVPRIYEYFVFGQLVTIAEMKEHLERSGNTLRKRLSELSARGYLMPIRQGLYMVCSVAERQQKAAASPFAIASRVSPNACVGYRSALQFHAGIRPSAPERVTVISETKFNAFSFNGFEYVWCQSALVDGVLVIRTSEFAPNVVRVTSPERTIIDCLRRPGFEPDLAELVSLSACFSRPPDFNLIIHHAQAAGAAALFNRLGLYLECMEGLWHVPAQVLTTLAKNASRKSCEWLIGRADHYRTTPIFHGGLGLSFQPSAERISLLKAKWKVHDGASILAP
jgi:predicted transcriptional regulator of viral defense system